ncbi:MAG: asparagine synthase (glutamine-hydrolyzing) [Gemmatimonadota bacterium]
MCGIAGLWRRRGSDPADGSRVERMAATLYHRGPDDHGFLLADTTSGRSSAGRSVAASFLPDLLLASRRLSIIDLGPSGQQPIANERGDIFVVFNGAIHNFVELRTELESLGHTFRSATDTEVIVHAYEEWGEACTRRFNGMWAFVLWDSRRGELLCSRDRFGIKPLFIAWHGDTFYFASEVKAILAGGEVPPTPDPAFVRRYLTFAWSPDGRGSAFAGIAQVPAAHNLVITRDGVRESRYWSCADQSEAYDYRDPAATFRDLFRDAVRVRLRSDVPIALLLSGGLDSSSIAVQARSQGVGGAMHAFTATFPGFEQDESQHATLVAAETGMPLHCVEYQPANFFDDLGHLAHHLDAPPHRSQELARWALLKAVAGHASVVLEGQGADEVLAGYPDLYARPYLHAEFEALRPWNFPVRGARMVSAWRLLNRLEGRPLLESLHLRKRPQAPPELSLLSPAFASSTDKGSWPVPDAFGDPLTQALYRDTTLRILPGLLYYGDVISMAHSVESRLPFLDHRLVEFAFGLPFDQKMRGARTKYVMRRAFAHDLPPAILARRDKVGFGTPVGRWLQLHLPAIREVLTSPRTTARGVTDEGAVAKCLSRFEADGSERDQLFRLIALETWYRCCVDGERTPG